MRYAMVSSANSLKLKDSDSGRSFMLRCNSHGPKIEPCDTSESTSTSSEDTPFSKTRYFLSVRNDVIHLMFFPSLPFLISFAMRCR